MLPGQTNTRPTKLEDLIDGRLLARIERLDVRSRRVFSGKLQGERRSKRRGRSVEFDDYRVYTPGDDLRFIDWNVYARFDRLFIKMFLEEEDLALHVVIDASASMRTGVPDKLLAAARIAMALVCIGLTQNNRVGVTVFGLPEGQEGASAGMARLGDLRGRRNIRRVGQFLLDTLWAEERSSASRTGAGSFSESLRTIARLRVGKGVMMLLSDFLAPDGYEPGLKALAAAGGYDTYCVQILSPGELEPEKESERGLSGDLRLTDVESGHATEVTMSPALVKRYKERLAQYCEGLDSFCAAREMRRLLVRSDADIEALMIDTMRRAGVVG
jgi:uncharacterized protein (DUF58 family)